MPERARRIASKLRHFVADRRHAKRREARLPLTVSLAATIRQNGFRKQASLDGHTVDLSNTGLSFVVPAIRIAEHYLTGEDRRLWLKIDLPNRPINMEVRPVRYESLDEEQSEKGYVIGVLIQEMTDEDRADFERYVKKLMGRRFF